MKKIILLLSLFLFAGCTVVRMDTSKIDNTLNVILPKENTLYNRIGRGYKYYVPRGVSYIETTSLNDKLYSSGVHYYLYIDAVSYFYKTKIEYEEKDNIAYSKKITGDKEGYLEIEEQDGLYHICFVYNYAKIEATAKKNQINDVVLNASYILSTVKFNDKVIELMLNEDYFTNKEEKYDLFKDNNESDTFVQYEEEE